MSVHYHALIMAGGGGTRLWPLSRQDRPKQSLRLLGERTLFQIAVERLGPLFPPERILVVTSAAYAADLQAQCPQLPAANFVLEPQPRGTAPAIGLAAAGLQRRDPQAVLACLTADHFIRDQARFRDLLMAAEQVAEQDYLVTLGITPTFAATGFGYIQRGEPLGTFGGFTAFKARHFKEKPVRSEAEAMLADGQHAWNSGMFVWRTARILAEMERQLPGLHRALKPEIVDPAAWSDLPMVTIDYGIMEHAVRVAVIPAEGLGWDDVGSWQSLLDMLPPDAEGNVVIGPEHLGLDTHGILVHGRPGRLVATLGLKDMVIVDTPDVLLICPRERAQEVRALVERLKQDPQRKQYL